MGNEINNPRIQHALINKHNKKIRMAYSLDDKQPVLCTLVSDQPFFYIDEAGVTDDDFFLSDDLMFDETLLEESLIENGHDPALVDELIAMKNKIDTYNDVTAHAGLNQTDAIADFEMDAQNICDAPQMTDLNDALELLLHSRYIGAFIDEATSQGVTIQTNEFIHNVQYDATAKAIFVTPHLCLEDTALLLARALRSFWQDTQIAMINPLAFDPDQAVLVNRAQKADLDGAMIRTAWELRLVHQHALWNRLEKSSYQDLARAYAREALSDFRTINNGRASAVLFESWFLSPRCHSADRNLINMMLSDYKDYIASDDQESKLTGFDMLCRIGEQPIGKNYLSGYANMIANDGLFTEVRERSNANFLWFIKFERNFEMAEEIADDLATQNKPKSDGIITREDNGITRLPNISSNAHQNGDNINGAKFEDNIIFVAFDGCGTVQTNP